MTSSPLERAQRIADFRLRAAAGTLTEDDMRQIVIDLREDRRASASAPSATKRKEAKAAIPSAAELTEGLFDGL